MFRSIGVSNYEVPHLAELLERAEVKPMVNQVELHPRRWGMRMSRQGGTTGSLPPFRSFPFLFPNRVYQVSQGAAKAQ